DGTMRAAVVAGPKAFRVDEVPRPEPDSGEVRVRVESCGVCGSDLTFYHQNLMRMGQTPGHEIAGVVDAVGPGVTGLDEGTRVAVEPLRTCGECVYCRSGRDSICRQTKLHGVHLAGGFAEAVTVPADRLYPLPADLDAAVAATTEPVAVAVHGLGRGRLEKGQRVLILGAGSVGLVTLIAARAMGAGEVWISARHEAQAELARQLGAARVLREEEASPESLGLLGLETDFDLVVESVGRGDTLRAACAAIRPGGTISVLGVFLGGVELEPLSLFLKEGNLVWSNCYHRRGGRDADFAHAVELVDSERESLSQLISHRLPLDEIGRAFEVAADKAAGAVKVSVQP
ncbi:MAG: zinc-binding dehydrogenase, partial [Planctomycetota bacterium]